MSDFETKHHFAESNLENPGTPTSLATGATVLTSLGFAIFAIGIVACFTTSPSAPMHPSAGTHRLESQSQLAKRIVHESATDIMQYSLAELALRPPPQAVVFSRGANFAIYHWRKDCPLLHNLQTTINFKTLQYLTRLQAEKRGYRYCHYCCEVERNDLTKLQQQN